MYRSYADAINDCLRKRREWAHLADQASKVSLWASSLLVILSGCTFLYGVRMQAPLVLGHWVDSKLAKMN